MTSPSNFILNGLPPEFDELRARLTPVLLPVSTSLYKPYEIPNSHTS
jgi:hypothetical protein